MLLVRAPDCAGGNRRIERHELPAMAEGEGEQIEIGYLARAMDSASIGDRCIEQAYVVGPEFVKGTRARFPEAFDDRPNGQRVTVTGVGHDADAAVLRDGTRRPTALRVVGEPLGGACVQ